MTRPFRDGESCIVCGTTERKHHARDMCTNCYAVWIRKQNPEVYRNIDRKHQQSDKRKKWRKEYESTDEYKKYILQKAKEWRERNPELHLERTRQWRLQNRKHLDAYNEAQKDIRLIKKYGEGALRLKIECGYKCQKCGSDNRVAVHHIDWNKHNNIYENFAILCNVCHSALHSWQPPELRHKIFEEWMNV